MMSNGVLKIGELSISHPIIKLLKKVLDEFFGQE